MIIHPNPGMIHTCHPMIILQHFSTIQGNDDPYLPSQKPDHPKIYSSFFPNHLKEFLTSDLFMFVEEISYIL